MLSFLKTNFLSKNNPFLNMFFKDMFNVTWTLSIVKKLLFENAGAEQDFCQSCLFWVL